MSSNSNPDVDGGEQQNDQAELSAFVDHACPVCGRPYEENERPCHPPDVLTFTRRLATGKWLLSEQRATTPASAKYPVVGSDQVSFEPTYLALQDLIQSAPDRFAAYRAETPYHIPKQPWIAQFYEHHLANTDEVVARIPAAIDAIEDRIATSNMEVTPARVFAHLVYLDQYGLLRGYDPLKHSAVPSLREWCADHYDVPQTAVDSKWVVERRVDRAKVSSTTPEFRQAWNLELTADPPAPTAHPHADCKPFNGTAVLGDHRDHNLVTQRATEDLPGLPYVDWTTAPHIIYSRTDYDRHDSTPPLPVLGFDFAGFQRLHGGPRLQYLGIVTDWDEHPLEIYLQIVQISKTAATGIVIFPNRKAIYDFLHILAGNELVRNHQELPDRRDAYSAIPNVQALHERLLHHLPLFEEMALLPRRKLMDEGLQTIDDLVSVPTYTTPNDF